MTTPPTPAEVAEARAWFDGHPDRVNEIGTYYVDSWTEEYAAVLVRYALAFGERAALAAPAEQPREDYPGWVAPDRTLVAFCRNVPDYDDGEPCSGEIRFRWGQSQSSLCSVCGARCGIAVAEWDRVEYDAARSVSESQTPSAVPAVSAGGAGRDLTAQDVAVALDGVTHLSRQTRDEVARELNGIARPAATWAQATEQTTETTTEYRVTATAPTGPVSSAAYSVWDARGLARGWRDRGWTDVQIESMTRTTTTSVSPWSPVAVHDENGAQR